MGSDEVRRQLHKCSSGPDGATHPAEITCLQIPKPAVNHLEAVGRSRAREVVFLDERHLQSGMGQLVEDCDPLDTAADHGNIEFLIYQVVNSPVHKPA